MQFNEFKANVEKWATERGIYQFSTSTAQLLKGLSELGELADSIIKSDIDGIKDGVGDVIVCLINYAKMSGKPIYDQEPDNHDSDKHKIIGFYAAFIGDILIGINHEEVPIYALKEIAEMYGINISDCYEHVWNEIKDRKGRMVEGGAFVKE